MSIRTRHSVQHRDEARARQITAPSMDGSAPARRNTRPRAISRAQKKENHAPARDQSAVPLTNRAIMTCAERGWFMSFAGNVTFKNAKALQATAAKLPADRLLIETDSPFLAPVPHRGKTCEPGFVSDTASFLAELRGEKLEDLAARTTDNFYALFSKAVRP